LPSIYIIYSTLLDGFFVGSLPASLSIVPST
jgi:hypothetical protein